MDDELKRISLVIFGIVALLALVGFILLFSETTKTGQAVLSKTTTTKETTYQKNTYPQKETTTTQSNSLNQKTISTKTLPLKEKRTSSQFTPPISSAPQPAPGDQDSSDAEGFAQCTTCAKQYEYRTMMARCELNRGQNVLSYADPGINAVCGSGRPSILHSEEHREAYITASCGDGTIINYGGKCSVETRLDIPESYIKELAPTGYTSEGTPATEWWYIPHFSQVRLACSENGDLQIYITCMREKQ